MKGKKLPWMKFFPGAWRNDPDLRRCSPGARGIWIDMLCLMFECEVRGVLATSGTAWSKREIAEAIGGDINSNLAFIDELLRKGVASQFGQSEADEADAGPEGAVYSRRMLADERKRGLCSAAGRRGGGNPNLTFKGVPKGRDKGQSQKALNTPLTSNVLSSPEGLGGAGEGEPPKDFELTAEGLAQAWCFYLTSKRRNAPRDSPLDVAAEMGELIRLGIAPEVIQAAILEKGRDRSEPLWEFRNRLKARAGMDPKKPPKRSEREYLAERAKLEQEQRERLERHPNANVNTIADAFDAEGKGKSK